MELNQTQNFIPIDPITWPPPNLQVLWLYNLDGSRKYMVASLVHTKCIDGSENLNFEEMGIDGDEWESDLDSCVPLAWQFIPTFDLPKEIN